jgi:hypothetical protein
MLGTRLAMDLALAGPFDGTMLALKHEDGYRKLQNMSIWLT